uniref:Uncharacterized protein n=1 Tax=Anguilla anguilla TaxID=7936 RepID=A0A0E9QAV7_ANGAN
MDWEKHYNNWNYLFIVCFFYYCVLLSTMNRKCIRNSTVKLKFIIQLLGPCN